MKKTEVSVRLGSFTTVLRSHLITRTQLGSSLLFSGDT